MDQTPPSTPQTAAPPSPAVLDTEPETGAGFPVVQAGPQLVPRSAHSADEGADSQRVIVRTSDPCDQLYAALAEAQALPDYGDVEKSRTARVTSKKGDASSYEYDYETLADVIDATRPFLARVGLVVIQFPFPGQRSVTIRTRLAHKSGQWLENDLTALIPMPDPQAVGGGITYLRRYAQKSILNVAARDEDDDAVHASGRGPQPQARREPPKPTPRRAAEPSPPAAGTPPVPAPALPTGVVVGLDEKRSDSGETVVGLVAKLDSGFQCATKDPELMSALRARYADGRRVELTASPPSHPRFAPVLREIALAPAAEPRP